MAQMRCAPVEPRHPPCAKAPVSALATHPLRLLLGTQRKLATPVLQVVHRVITRYLLGHAGLKSDEAGSRAVTLIRRFGAAVNLNIHFHCLVLDGRYWRGIDGAPEFVEFPESTDEALQAVLHKIDHPVDEGADPSGGVGRRRWPDLQGGQRQ
ncbi:MAG: hypothetical protein CFE45_18380 [Burkholderiales bacterium PBB5]|nr:MAG: hypothetical protein CFE45_18380 [Burkholderiales bacterium PBB5]